MTTALTLVETTRQERQRPRWYTNAPGRPYMSPTYREYEAKPRLYISVQGETILENLAYRKGRPHQLYRELLPEIFADLGLPTDTKANWSQKAGCSCGCSPGFILTGSGDERADFWATVEGTPDAKLVNDPDAAALANDRVGQVLADPTIGPAFLGRGKSGKLRNFKAMSDDKLRDVLAQLEEGTDNEALEAARAEVMRRFKQS